MAVAYVSRDKGTVNFGTSISFATTTSGTDKLLLGSVSCDDPATTISDIQYNSISLTSAAAITESDLGGEIGYTVAPSASANLVVSFSASIRGVAFAHNYQGVDQTTPIGTPQTVGVASSASAIGITVSSETDGIVFDFCARRFNVIPTIDVSQTDRGSDATLSRPAIACSEKVGAASVDMDWTFTGFVAEAIQIGLPIKPASGGSSISLNGFNGKIIIKNSAISLLDGMLIVKDAVTNLLDGRAQIKNTTTNLLDGLIVISNNNTDLLDGKIIIKSSTTGIFDGKVQIQDIATDLFDGKIQIQDIATDLVDGKVQIKTDAINLVDGKIIITNTTIGLLDGKIVVKDANTILLDGKLVIQSDNAINLFDGKIILTRLATGKVTLTFEVGMPTLGIELSVPTVNIDLE